MIKGRTSSGFEYTIPEGLKNDWRFVRAFQKLNRGTDEYERLEGATALIECIFSDSAEEERFYKHLAAQSETGRVPTEIVFKEAGEIVDHLSNSEELKN